MSTILIGVDDSERSQDAIALGRRVAAATTARVVVACAFPYNDGPSRAANLDYRRALESHAIRTARRMSELLSNVPSEQIRTTTVANPSPAHALQDLAESSHASIVVVGATRTGRAGRVLLGATAERMLHGAPCPVAVAPQGYAVSSPRPIQLVGVAYDGSVEAASAVVGGAALARALHADLEIIGVVAPETYAMPMLSDGSGYVNLRADIEDAVQDGLDAQVAGLPAGIHSTAVRLSGGPAECLIERSAQLALLVMGSRGYGPLHAVLTGGVSGRVTREARCPVVVVPRGVSAPLGGLFGATAVAGA